MSPPDDSNPSMLVSNLEPSEPETGSFTWPPTPGSLVQPPPLLAAPLQPGARAPNPLLESIETTLLGRTGLAFDLWAQRTGWTPETPADYCWRCGGTTGDHESDGEGCSDCRGKTLPWDRALRLGRYGGVLRTEILGLKFHRWQSTGIGLGKYLGYSIKAELERAQVAPGQAVLVPIPMHRFRRVSRGIDHTRVIATAAAKVVGCKAIPLLSAQYRPEQVGLSMTARAANIKGAFWVSKRNARRIARFEKNTDEKTKIRVYILIDDVRTTGATFVAGCRAFKAGFPAPNASSATLYAPPTLWTACLGVAGESRRKRHEMPI